MWSGAAVVIGFEVLMIVVLIVVSAVIVVSNGVLSNRVLGQVMMCVQPTARGAGHHVGSQQGNGCQRMAAKTEHAPLLYRRLPS